MMKKGIATFLAVCSILWITAFAEGTQPIITSAHFYKGTLYYCDAEQGVLVLKNLKAMGKENQENARTAKEAEYTELPLTGLINLKNGTVLSMEDCNYYPDSDVRVLIVRSSDDTLQVVQMKFL